MADDIVLYIIRGLPGAGKTTLAHKLTPNVVEADQFMVNERGEYEFDPSRLAESHQACYERVATLLRRRSTVAVSNTFVSFWEYERYIKLAEEMDIPYQIVSVKGHPSWKSIHGVPEATIQHMAKRWTS